jgi:hypothetical protein
VQQSSLVLHVDPAGKQTRLQWPATQSTSSSDPESQQSSRSEQGAPVLPGATIPHCRHWLSSQVVTNF